MRQYAASQRAFSGDKGEKEIFDLLGGLPNGWCVERNVKINGIGDVDILIQAPEHWRTRHFAIEVKAHRGCIGFDGELLYRTRQGAKEAFEKDFLKQSMHQALAVRDAFGYNFVVPLVVFARAAVPFSGEKKRGVIVLAKEDLLQFLTSYESGAVSETKAPGKAIAEKVTASRNQNKKS